MTRPIAPDLFGEPQIAHVERHQDGVSLVVVPSHLGTPRWQPRHPGERTRWARFTGPPHPLRIGHEPHGWPTGSVTKGMHLDPARTQRAAEVVNLAGGGWTLRSRLGRAIAWWRFVGVHNPAPPWWIKDFFTVDADTAGVVDEARP